MKNDMSQFYFISIITVLVIYGTGQQRNRRDKKCRQINNDFDNHADAAVRCGVHHPMKHNHGFTLSQWMPPSGECSHHIIAAAAMGDDFG